MSKEYVDYEEAATDIKAVIFDIVEHEKKTTDSLKNKISKESDEKIKSKLEKVLENKETKLEDIMSSIDLIIKNVEFLNNINIKNNLALEDSELDSSDDFSLDLKTEDNNEEENISDFHLPIEPSDTEEKEENSIGVSNEKEVENEDNNLEEASEELEETSEVIEESTDEASEETVNNTEVVYAFNKDTKILPRAIMVKQSDQYPKLKESCDKQIEKLTTIGAFDDYNYEVSTANSLNGNVINEDIEEELGLNNNDYDDLERYIEDLTVKASIYTNEGEIEKANAINKKIDELKNKDEVNEDN